jgi:acyl-CoA synthetase (AMP-forming)/AMP-acid ligase II
VLLPDLLRASARKFPTKTAVSFPDGTRLSFGELDHHSDRVAARLASLGIGPKDRVGIISENDAHALMCWWGIMKTGAESVDVPAQAGQATIEGVVEEARPKALCVQGRLLGKLVSGGKPAVFPQHLVGAADARADAEKAGLTFHALEDILADTTTPVPALAVHEDDVAMIVYTSGTTGRPKGVMLSHKNLNSNISAANELVGLTDADSILLVVPFYFIHGRMQLLTHAMISGTVHVSGGFQFPTTVLDELLRHQVSGFSGVPYHFLTLMERTKLKSTPLPHLKYLLVTGGALAPTSVQELQAMVPTVGIHTAYGQTEASPRITWLGPKDMFRKLGSAGIPLPGVTVETVDGRGEPVAKGEIGEVMASGPNIMTGYVSGDERTSGRIDARGRLCTGDLGRFDDEGYLYLVGRSSDMIKTAGERVFPKEVEDVIAAHPAVAENAVIGVKDALLGEKIVALVVLRPEATLTLKLLREHCVLSMPFVRAPRELRIVPAFPKTASGKINRSELMALAAATAASP